MIFLPARWIGSSSFTGFVIGRRSSAVGGLSGGRQRPGVSAADDLRQILRQITTDLYTVAGLNHRRALALLKMSTDPYGDSSACAASADSRHFRATEKIDGQWVASSTDALAAGSAQSPPSPFAPHPTPTPRVHLADRSQTRSWTRRRVRIRSVHRPVRHQQASCASVPSARARQVI